MSRPASSSNSRDGKKRKGHHWLIDVVLAFFLVMGFHAWQTRSLAHGPAPTLSGSMLDGNRRNLESYLGAPVLVHFWATWCPVCKMEEDSIQDLAQDYPVLTVAMQSEGASAVNKYMQDNGLDFPVMLDDDGSFSRAWGVTGVPASFVIDAQGNIRSVAVGYTTKLGLRFRLWLASL